MFAPPLQSSPVALMGLSRTGVIQTVVVSRSGRTSRYAIRVQGWSPGTRPKRLVATRDPRLLIALSSTPRGDEVALIRLSGRRSAKVVDRSVVRAGFYGLGASFGRRSFFLPQGGGSGATFRVEGARIRWDRPPHPNRTGSEFVVLGLSLDERSPAFWLDVSSMSDSVLFGVNEVDRGLAREINPPGYPITSVRAIGAWRKGARFWAIDGGGVVYRLLLDKGEAEPLKGEKPLGDLGGFAMSRAAPWAVAMTIEKALLLKATPAGGWAIAASTPVRFPLGNVRSAVSEDGRWSAIVSQDGTAHLLQIGGKPSIRLVRRIPKFVAPLDQFIQPFAFIASPR